MAKLNNKFLEFEKIYVDLRQREGWLLNDESVRLLPKVKKGSNQYSQWRLRAHSSKKTLSFLRTQERGRILDLGCGNGWMSNQMAKEGFLVTGMEVNKTELDQAQRVFGNSIQWELEDVFNYQPRHKFELILLSASLQYFEDLETLFSKLFSLMMDGGSILVMDTFIYEESDRESAKQRSEEYYKSQEAPEMAAHYFHHTWKALSSYQIEYIYRPKRKWRGIIRSPFPIFRVLKP